jgi:lysophospholipid acyltransferase 7
VYNVDPWGAEVVPTLRLGMHCWNTTVQYWLAMYVYKRVPSKSLRCVGLVTVIVQ